MYMYSLVFTYPIPTNLLDKNTRCMHRFRFSGYQQQGTKVRENIVIIISSENFRKMGPVPRSAFLESPKAMGIFTEKLIILYSY